MPTSRVIVILYAFAATAHVMATAAGPASLAWATAPLLMPLLVGVVIFAAVEGGQRPRRWLLTGLVLATVADVASLAGPSPSSGWSLVAASIACYAIAVFRGSDGGQDGLSGGSASACWCSPSALLAVRLSAPVAHRASRRCCRHSPTSSARCSWSPAGSDRAGRHAAGAPSPYPGRGPHPSVSRTARRRSRSSSVSPRPSRR